MHRIFPDAAGYGRRAPISCPRNINVTHATGARWARTMPWAHPGPATRPRLRVARRPARVHPTTGRADGRTFFAGRDRTPRQHRPDNPRLRSRTQERPLAAGTTENLKARMPNNGPKPASKRRQRCIAHQCGRGRAEGQGEAPHPGRRLFRLPVGPRLARSGEILRVSCAPHEPTPANP